MASSLNKGVCPPSGWWHQGGMASKLHGVCHSEGGPLRLHLREGQCSDFTGADVVRKDLPPVATVMGDQGLNHLTPPGNRTILVESSDLSHGLPLHH